MHEGDERRHPQGPEVAEEHDVARCRVGRVVALGRERRQTERLRLAGVDHLAELHDRVLRRVGELALPELRVAAADLLGLEDHGTW